VRITLTLRVKIDPFHRVFDTLFGIDAAAIGMNVRGQGKFLRRRILFAAGLNGPRLKIFVLGHQWPNASDLAVLYINGDGPGIGTTGENLFTHLSTSRILNLDEHL